MWHTDSILWHAHKVKGSVRKGGGINVICYIHSVRILYHGCLFDHRTSWVSLLSCESKLLPVLTLNYCNLPPAPLGSRLKPLLNLKAARVNCHCCWGGGGILLRPISCLSSLSENFRTASLRKWIVFSWLVICWCLLVWALNEEEHGHTMNHLHLCLHNYLQCDV